MSYVPVLEPDGALYVWIVTPKLLARPGIKRNHILCGVHTNSLLPTLIGVFSPVVSVGLSGPGLSPISSCQATFKRPTFCGVICANGEYR